MIRLRRLILDDMRNVLHGVLDFDDLPAGGSVTGIYGQNGSGKTTVIDAIGLLRALLAGDPLPETAGDAVNASSGEARLTAAFLIEEGTTPARYLEYRVTLRKAGTHSMGARVVAESVRIGGSLFRLGREVMSHSVEETDGGGFALAPAYVWRSLGATASTKKTIERTGDRAYTEGRSFLFSRRATLDGWADDHLLDWIVEQAETASGISARSAAYVRDRFAEFARLRAKLCHYAINDVFISTTRRSAPVSLAYIPLMEENPKGRNQEFLFDLLQANAITPGQTQRLEETVHSFDRILPALVPGLHIELRTSAAPSGEHGEDRIMAELFSRRGDVTIPFRCESEGIIRITALLGYLKHAYNDSNALVAVDEFDSGVFELLLGDILRQLADGCVGQLIFTAHNLRALEVLPNSCIRTTLTDPDNRFAAIPRRSATNNQRKRYLAASELGWDGPDIYDAPTPRMFGNSLYAAGHPHDDESIDDDLAALNASGQAVTEGTGHRG